MIIFVEGNKVDISEFINGFKSSIAFIGDKLKVNLDVAKDKIKVIEEMHRIMCEQDKKIKMFEKKLDSEGKEDCCCKSNESQIENLKERNKYLSEQVKELSRLNSEKEDEILLLESEKKKLYNELQLEKAINRRLGNTIKNLTKGDEIGKKYSTPTFAEDAYITSDAIIPKEVIAGIIFERPKFL